MDSLDAGGGLGRHLLYGMELAAWNKVARLLGAENITPDLGVADRTFVLVR